MPSDAGRFRIGAGEFSGAVADLGVFAPLAIALVVVNGLPAGSVLLAAGLLVIASGVVFRVPFPVQPLKALTAVAVAQGLAPEVIHAAGLELAAFLLLLSIGGLADRIGRWFTLPVIRSLQFGVGILLMVTSFKLLRDPPAAFSATPSRPYLVALAIGVLAIVVWEAHRKHVGVALAVLAIGVVAAVVATGPDLGMPTLTLPTFSLPPGSAFATAFLLLVVPQLPLTFGNAVVAVSSLEHEYFGQRAQRVTPSTVCISCATGNIVSALIGGMPMCHGSGGLTAHYRLGARTAGMNLVLGTAFVVMGLFFADQVVTLVGLLPLWALAAFLAYAGLRHAVLIFDLRGRQLVAMMVLALAGVLTGNLAVTTVAALLWVHLVERSREVA